MHIDIAAHRPHPPGYLGYVLVARALDWLTHDVNTSLVVWNMIATALTTLVIIQFAVRLADDEAQGLRMAVTAAVLCISSPLVWFYGEIAEIYASEMLVSLLVAYTAWRAVRGQPAGLYWCAGALAAAALFKMTAAVLMAPLVIYAWILTPPYHAKRAAALLGALLGVVAAVFFSLQPNLIDILWTHFLGTTSESRLVGGQTSPLKAFNRNLRDTFTAAVSGLGLLNAIGLTVWAIADRRLPARIGRSFAWLWLAPWMGLFLFVHISKGGYVLPVLPLVLLVLAAFYARKKTTRMFGLLSLVVVANAAQFLWLGPPGDAMVGRDVLYRDRSRLQRVLSDLEGITVPTSWTIGESDRRVAMLQQFVAQTCPSGAAIIIAGDTVDYRRLLWYFPGAWTVDVGDLSVRFIGQRTESVPVTATGAVLKTSCPIVWLGQSNGSAGPFTPSTATRLALLGSFTAAGELRITPTAIQ